MRDFDTENELSGIIRSKYSRRGFLGLTGLAAGLGITGCAATRPHAARLAAGSGKTRTAEDKSTVALVSGSDRRQATYDALKIMRENISAEIGNRQVVVKVNAGFPTENHRIHSTYPGQVRGILDFLRDFYDGEVWISEGVGSSTGTMFDGYELYGLMDLKREYAGLKYIDANQMPSTRKWIRQWHQHPTPINIISMYHLPEYYIISAARLKTHNAVVGTFSLKNIVMGSPLGAFAGHPSEKGLMHGGTRDEGASGRELSYNMFTLALEGVYPDLAVVDGATGIEGNGPWDGTEVEHAVTVASTDFVACDRVCTEIAGIDPFYMKYLEWCGQAELGNWNMDKITVRGARLKDHVIRYKLNENVAEQVAWIDRNFTR